MFGFIGELEKDGSHKGAVITSPDTPSWCLLYHPFNIQVLHNYSSVAFANCRSVFVGNIVSDVVDLVLDFLFLQELLLVVLGVPLGS